MLGDTRFDSMDGPLKKSVQTFWKTSNILTGKKWSDIPLTGFYDKKDTHMSSRNAELAESGMRRLSG